MNSVGLNDSMVPPIGINTHVKDETMLHVYALGWSVVMSFTQASQGLVNFYPF